MQTIKTRNWYYTAQDDKRGYIQPHALRELWFHLGTACNLSCPFCLEGSKPGDDRLDRMNFNDVQPWLDQAVALGVEKFSFTGGEPFIIKDLVKILSYAAQHKPCLVLTNGTDPLLKRLHQLPVLQQQAHPVSFRISLDYPDAALHDQGRGAGSFALSMQALKHLSDMGFHVSVARLMQPNEDTQQVNQCYREVLQQHQVPNDVNLVVFPDFHHPGSEVAVPQITEDCMTRYHTAASRQHFMCAFSKMVVKQQGKLQVYACTLVDDDPDYNLGDDLAHSLQQRISLKHHRCFSCFKFGASCSEG